MLELHYHKKVFSLPENYNELTGKQLLQVNELLLLQLPLPVLRLKLLQVLLGIGQFSFFMLPADLKHRLLYHNHSLSGYMVDDASVSAIDWIINDNNLTEQLLPVYNGFYGPKKEFDNLTVKEFHVCEIAYSDYIQEQTEEHLNKLVAVLYRPCKKDYDFTLDKDGDARIFFNPNELNYYTNIVSKWPAAAKMAIFSFYDGNREYLKTLYDEVFESSGSSAAEGDAGMYDVIRNLAGTKYGTFKEVEELLLHDVLHEIVSAIKDNQRLEQQLPA